MCSLTGVVLLLIAKELVGSVEKCLLLVSFWLVLKEVVTERPEVGFGDVPVSKKPH